MFEERVKNDPGTDYTRPEAFNTAIWYIAEEARRRGFLALRTMSVDEIAADIANQITDRGEQGFASLPLNASLYSNYSQAGKKFEEQVKNDPGTDYTKDAHLSGAHLPKATGVNVEKAETEENVSTLRIRIVEEPLIAHNFTTIISALTELHTKAWLIQQGRFPDLINYAQTHDIRFTKEAHLTIGKLAHNSPTLVELILNPATLTAGSAAVVTLAGALKIAIDNVGQTRLRYRAAELENQKKELEMKIREQEAQQAQQKAAQKAALEAQKTQLEIREQLLQVQEKTLEVERNRMQIALETASKMVDTLRPGVDMATKEMLVQPLLPNLLQLSITEGLELASHTQKSNGEKTETKQNG